MKIKKFETYKNLCENAAAELIKLLASKPNAQICIAAGHSSLGVFDELIRAYKNSDVDFSQAVFTAMDEWMDMNETTDGSCGDFLVKNFLSQVNFQDDNISLVNGKSAEPENECKRISSWISSHGGMDHIILGVGMNGHLALNEPGVSPESTVHVTKLDSVTKSVGQKYFEKAPQLEGGITIGIKDIEQSGRVLLVVNGARKAEIVKKIADSDITGNIPATFLKGWDHADIWCDSEAGALL